MFDDTVIFLNVIVTVVPVHTRYNLFFGIAFCKYFMYFINFIYIFMFNINFIYLLKIFSFYS